MNNKETSKNGNKNGSRDYSHLPRARDFKLPEKISPELKAAMEATREAMEALQREEEKYGKKPRF
jgi:GH25 family lysozyme M1 (1,4-beta-N-acetylmuramidase)